MFLIVLVLVLVLVLLWIVTAVDAGSSFCDECGYRKYGGPESIRGRYQSDDIGNPLRPQCVNLPRE